MALVEEYLRIENEELKKELARLKRIIEKLVDDASFNACQPFTPINGSTAAIFSPKFDK